MASVQLFSSVLNYQNSLAGVSFLLNTGNEEYAFAEYYQEEEEAEEAEPEEPMIQNRWGLSLTQEEIDLLAKILWLEARGEPDEGQQAVVEVVLNRVVHESFPDTVYDVLSDCRGGYQQFSTWTSRNSASPTEKEYRNINAVLVGGSWYTTLKTVYFSTFPQTKTVICVIGSHFFCE